jgi:hypothetical protein
MVLWRATIDARGFESVPRCRLARIKKSSNAGGLEVASTGADLGNLRNATF